MSDLLVVYVTAPLLVGILQLAPIWFWARATLSIMSAVLTMGISLWIISHALPVSAWGGALFLDDLGALLGFIVALVYLLAAIYSVGYLLRQRELGEDLPARTRYVSRYFFLFNLFAATMLWVPAAGNLMLMWLAIELTTVVSALLVGIEHHGGAGEAAWKYIVIASSCLTLALLGILLLYFAAGSGSAGTSSSGFTGLLLTGARLAPTPVRVAFAFVLIGFGAKVGLVPGHTWLPDAHSEAAAPVSAMLSGALLADAMYGILRVYPLVVRAVGRSYPDTLLFLVCGASLLLAGFSAVRQNNLKRLYAYSSIEHMGIIGTGVAIGGPIALYGVMLQLVAHATSKALCFMGAGSLLAAYGLRDTRRITGVVTVLPLTALFLLLGAFVISGLPPSALFRSELTIAIGGMERGDYLAVLVLLSGVGLVFLGVFSVVNKIVFGAPQVDPQVTAPSVWMNAAMLLAAIPAVALCFYVPPALSHVMSGAVALVGGR